jgi:hypothetical protein
MNKEMKKLLDGQGGHREDSSRLLLCPASTPNYQGTGREGGSSQSVPYAILLARICHLDPSSPLAGLQGLHKAGTQPIKLLTSLCSQCQITFISKTTS